jgi:hypothetical protein
MAAVGHLSAASAFAQGEIRVQGKAVFTSAAAS